ncbi:MAG: protoheme IX farnesyltransferase [Planctomycetota bacterium]
MGPMLAVWDFLLLIRPRILAMVLLSMAAAAWATGAYPPTIKLLVHALVGAGLLIAGAVTFNQRLEMRGDARMRRTAGRPLPAGRLSSGVVSALGSLLTVAGLGYLAMFCGPKMLIWAAASWATYVLIYTPLKARSTWQTPIGALAGAMPVLLGAAMVDAEWSLRAISLFAIVFFWQWPHAMAIAWLYRDEFAAADVRLTAVVDPSGRSSIVLALAGAAAILPASALAAWSYELSPGLSAGLAVLGALYLGFTLRFARQPDARTARALLRASVVYLPAAMLLIVLAAR